MRVWELRDHGDRRDYDRDSEYNYRMGMHEKTEHEAYECGYEDGYEDAMEELDTQASHRSNYRMKRRGGR